MGTSCGAVHISQSQTHCTYAAFVPLSFIKVYFKYIYTYTFLYATYCTWSLNAPQVFVRPCVCLRVRLNVRGEKKAPSPKCPGKPAHPENPKCRLVRLEMKCV